MEQSTVSHDKKLILIVDDNADNLEFLSRILSQAGYQFRRAIDGSVGLNAAQRLRPDLILLDIMMPGLSGYEVCQCLKADPQTRDIPVLFMSTLDRGLDKAKAFEVGGVDYITKPFEQAEVLARVHNHLSLRAFTSQLQSSLAHQLKQRASELADEAERERGLAQVIDKIRRSLDLDIVFQTATRELRKIFAADRVAVMQCLPPTQEAESRFQVVSEDLSAGSASSLGHQFPCETFRKFYLAHEREYPLEIGDVDRVSVASEFAMDQVHSSVGRVLERFQISAGLIVPLMKGRNRWGYLGIFQNLAPRNWGRKEIEFAQKVCIQLGVALQQAELLSQAQSQSLKLCRTLADLNGIMDNLADGLLVVEPTEYIARANPSLERMFGWKQQVFLGQPMADCFPEALVAAVRRVQASATSAETIDIKLPQERQGQAIISPLMKLELEPDFRSDSNLEQYAEQKADLAVRAQGCVIVIRDVTAEREISRMKQNFLATVSHELRTPLTSILGFSALIEAKLDDPIIPAMPTTEKKAVKALKTVRSNVGIMVAESERLTALVNDVLDFHRMGEEQFEWNFQKSDPGELLERAIATVMPLIQEKGLAIIRDFSRPMDSITLDQNCFLQVVINLISNSIKFTDAGHIKCSAELAQQGFKVSISDTGQGIPKSEHKKVFEKFIQVGDVLTSKPKGTGLGLAICKQIINHHQGSIWVESEPGNGSMFSFVIPNNLTPSHLSEN